MRLLGWLFICVAAICVGAAAGSAQDRERGTTEQRAAAQDVVRSLVAGTFIQTRGGFAGEGHHGRLTGEHSPLADNHPCRLEIKARFYTLSGSPVQDMALAGYALARVATIGGPEIALHFPFSQSGAWHFVLFPDDATARRAAIALERWRAACTATDRADPALGLNTRLPLRMTEGLVTIRDVPPGEARGTRRIVGMLIGDTSGERSALQCGRPLVLYTVPILPAGFGDRIYTRGHEHQGILLEQARVTRDGTRVVLRPTRAGLPVEIAMPNAGMAEALQGDLALYTQRCLSLRQR